MLLKNLDRFKVSTTDLAVTSYAGLLLPLGMGRSLGLDDDLNRLAVKERRRGYTSAEMGFTLMGLIQAGGESLDEVKHLSQDAGLQTVFGVMPAANTLGQYLRRFTKVLICQLGWTQLKLAVKIIKRRGLKRVTLDVDAFFVESQKDGVLMNYEGLLGYCPMMVTCAELGMPIAAMPPASPVASSSRTATESIRARGGVSVRSRTRNAFTRPAGPSISIVTPSVSLPMEPARPSSCASR